MKLYTGILGILLGGALLTFSACKKNDSTPTNNNANIVTKNGLLMNGDQEVPAKNTSAYGTVNVSYDKSSKKLDFTIVWYSLTGVPTGAHMHGPAAKGTNAGIVFDFFAAFPSAVAGTFSSSTTVDGTKINQDSLLAGKYYFNIHTAANPGGEIRAQVEF